MLSPYLIIISYALLGAGIKYIDQAYDIDVFSKRIAKFVALPCGVLMGSLIIFDPPSAIIFFALVISLALTQKIDNIAFYVGTGVLLLLLVIFHDTLQISWLPFGILLFSGIIDELGNDWADQRIMRRLLEHTKNNTNTKFTYHLGEKFFLNRFMMKIGIFSLAFFNFFPWLYFIAFMAFDIMYLLVEEYSLRSKKYSIDRRIAAVK